MRKKIALWSVLLLSFVFVGCSPTETVEANYEVVPLPKQITKGSGEDFILDNSVQIVYPADNDKMKRNAEFLATYINEMLNWKPAVVSGEASGKAIVLGLVDSGEAEGYELNVTSDKVTIHSSSEAGVFYGIQTFRKSLPVAANAHVSLPAVSVQDAPRFGYRGSMLDVSRHFFPLEFIKEYIDVLALHNINRFHWHLSEDQGWRIEIKKYPKLTEIGSKRTETVIGRNSGEYDGIPYGGFYTQEEAKEIVAYAQERYITVIPEIDMPGHMQAALAAYPELGCTGGPYEVWKQWGISDDVLCIGNDKTLEFITDVLAEIIEIFPSEYIHVGGDECPKVRWKECAKCQARIRAEGLVADKEHSAEDRLQSFAINHAEKFLNENGRQIIGWDEILEGGLAPNATVMSWRGVSGGVQAAKMGHDAIMTPTDFLYFDYYQTKDTETEPLAIGGYVPIEKVYSFEPIHPSLNSEEAKHIIGTQANLWTEYVLDGDHVLYMLLPRMAALSEVQWCAPEQKDYDDFLTRIPRLIDIYNLKNYNYATHLFDINATFTPNTDENVLDVFLTTIDDSPIHYTLDGTEPTAQSAKFDGVIKIDNNCVLKAVVIRGGSKSKVLTEEIFFSKSSMKPITMLQPVNKQYEFEGAPTLVDGLKGNGNYKTGRWIAFFKNDLEAVIDLQEAMEISTVELSTCVEKGDWVFDARGFEVSVSDDGESFTTVFDEKYPEMKETDRNGLYDHKLEFDSVTTRYVKVKGLVEHSIPSWHGGKGNPGFLFVDEIVIN